MNLKPISKKQILKNYAFNSEFSFSVVTAATETELNEKVVDNYLRKFSKDGVLNRTRRKGIYYYIYNHPSRNKAGPKFKPEHVQTFVNIILNYRCDSVRQISKLSGFSRQLVFSYLEAMASVDVIGFNGNYFIKDQSRIAEVGTQLEKHILGRLKRKVPTPWKVKKKLLQMLRRVRRIKDNEDSEWIRTHRRRV